MNTAYPFLPLDEDILVGTNRIKKRIRAMRISQKLTQKQMAEALGISERSYSDKENILKGAEFKLSEILAISKRLEVMAGLIVADHWSPELVGRVMRVMAALGDLEPDVQYCLNYWEQAKLGKTNSTNFNFAEKSK